MTRAMKKLKTTIGRLYLLLRGKHSHDRTQDTEELSLGGGQTPHRSLRGGGCQHARSRYSLSRMITTSTTLPLYPEARDLEAEMRTLTMSCSPSLAGLQTRDATHRDRLVTVRQSLTLTRASAVLPRARRTLGQCAGEGPAHRPSRMFACHSNR